MATETKRSRRLPALLLGLLAAGLLLACLRGKLRLLRAVPLSLAFGALAALLTLRRVELRSWRGALLANACVAVMSVFLLHLPMFGWLDPHRELLLNMGIAMSLLCLATAVSANVRAFGAFWLVFCAAFGFLDAAVFDFRSNTITFSDLFVVRTALNVAGNYRLTLTRYQLLAVALCVVCVAMLLRVKEARPRLRRWPARLIALACALACLGASCAALWPKSVNTWRKDGVKKHGVIGELLLEARDYFMPAPDGYSDGEVARLSGENALPAAEGDRPSVIVVMNESFSDLAVLGDLKTNVDYMPSFRALEGESIHGRAVVSTLGGGTSRTEWETLTGNTMAFMPKDCSPFDQFIKKNVNSAVKVFQGAGYHTVGMHPFRSDGYHRDSVYPALGFDEIYFEPDLDWGERVRGIVSDHAFVQQVIDIYENRPEGKPLFLFGVTMQNHGGYRKPNFTSDVHVEGLRGQYPDVEQYLSLIRLSDASLKELTDYFRGRDEKVQILFFGDHQPNLSDAFLQEIGMKNRSQRFIVPFLIWNNYDQRSEAVAMTSPNFLLARLMKESGLTGAPYFNYLNRLSEKLPAISTLGYLYEGSVHDLEDDAAEDLLKDYRILQYGNVFRTGLDERLFVGEAADP